MLLWEPLKILSYGGGTPSTTLALMSCHNKSAGRPVYKDVPIYDIVLFCDLHVEPSWVYRQVEFVWNACNLAGIPFITLDADLYGDFTRNFGQRRVATIPLWTLDLMPGRCTCDYKIKMIEKYFPEWFCTLNKPMQIWGNQLV